MAETFLSGFYLDGVPAAPAARAPDCRVRITRGTPPSVPEGMDEYPSRHGVCYADGESYHLEVSGSRVVVGPPEARRVDVWFGDTPRALGPVARVNVMSYTLHAALRRCGLYDLHAAGAIEPESGAGVLLVGASNSGKSTLALRLARSGWRYLSDDLLLLHDDGGAGAVKARGLRRVFSVSASTLAGCDLPRLEDALGEPVNSDPDKRRLDPSIVFPGGFGVSCEPRAIFFPEVTGEAETRVEPLGRAETLLRLLRLCPWSSFDAKARDNLNFLGRLVNQARGYALRAGRDVLADPGFAPSLLAGYVNS